MAATAKTAGKQKSFEESLRRLEEVVKKLEGGELPLEEMMARFEEGTALVKFCSEKLNQVEKTIEQLVKKGDEVFSEPFPAAGGEAEDPAERH